MASEIDPAELARLREACAKAFIVAFMDEGGCYLGDISAKTLLALLDALQRAEGQLPDGMKHCTIVFEECPKGHGHLRGTNWIKHPCVICERNSARALLQSLLSAYGLHMSAANRNLISAFLESKP